MHLGRILRRLICIPVIHTEVDMGSVSEAVRRDYLARYGKAKWAEHLKLIGQLWDTIRKKILAMPLDYGRTRLYQDGLPLCGREEEIVRELAGLGSRNHLLLLELMERGGRIIGTEDPELLLQEHGNIKEMLGSSGGRDGKGRGALRATDSAALLAKRDEFIARRIADTLGEGETGVLFIGALHKVERILPRDIRVSYLT